MLVVALIACSPSPQAHSQTPAANVDVSELWQEPVDLASRDLFLGPGGAALAPPSTDGKFQFVAFKTSGTNPGYEVKDGAGRSWSVKLGIEAQPEIVASRIVWAMGFPQPPQYFVHQFTLTGTGDTVIKNARFRTDTEHWKSVADWSWYDNPFLNTTPFHGLIVAQLILNNWDLKTINNRIYEEADATTLPRRHYMVRDLGATLGWSKQFALFNLLGTVGGQGSKNDIAGFEAQGFIKSVDGNKVTFDYRGAHLVLVKRVTLPDVVWACELLARISNEQWQAAFRAGAYPQAEANRYIKKIEQKIAQGLALKTATPAR
ncbi:MAG: hypothetical protein ABI983_01390 [Acidobacteriota bacterium]